MKMETAGGAAFYMDKLEEIFPGIMTEALDEENSTPDEKKYKRAVNFDLLRQLLEDQAAPGWEAYELTWVGKRESMVEANRPSRATLRPCREESENWENTRNLYLEGENLEILKLLQESYLGEVKLIYIDPPYNTGKDFIYPDNFAETKKEHMERMGGYNEMGKRLLRNTEKNGRFHSDWCTMLYPRLAQARNLLKKEGAIFISINDRELHSLKFLCDEVFGARNYVCTFSKKGSGGRQDSEHFAVVHEYILCYARSIRHFVSGKIVKEDDKYPFYDEAAKKHYKLQLLRKWGENSRRSDRPNLYYPIPDPDGGDHYPMVSEQEEGCWRWGKDKMKQETENGRVEFKKRGDAWVAYEKVFQPEEDRQSTKLYTTWIDDIGSSSGTPLVRELLDGKYFGYPKPVELMERILQMGNTGGDDIILDFFSGSATTAHAVMNLNARDGQNRRFIMVQIPEETAEGSEPYTAGYHTICQLGRERIRRAGKQVAEEVAAYNSQIDVGEAPKPLPDTGFRTLRLDSTNMKDVYYSAAEYGQEKLDDYISNIKEDRSDEDLLYSCLLELGIFLSLPHASETIGDAVVHTVNGGELIACFTARVSEQVVREIAGRKPQRAVFRDSCFADSPQRINVEEVFKLLSPGTSLKVL